MKTFTDQELRLIRKLRQADVETTLAYREPCPNHSACMPLPLFRVYRESDDGFRAEWNAHHQRGPSQEFLFSQVLGE